jgi:hypothetical protein
MIIGKQKKPKEPLDLVNYKKQGNLAIDMCAECIMYERQRGKNVKAIILHPAYYQMLQAWVAREYGEEAAMKEFFLDFVEIRKERITSGKSLLIEYYEPEKIV